MNSYLVAKCAFATLCCCTMVSAEAITYSNFGAPGEGISSFGAPDSTNYGETFASTGGLLQDFTFYAKYGVGGNVALVIAMWDGAKAVGPALYVSAPILYTGGNESIGAYEINLALQSNTNYIAYLTVAGIADPVVNVTMEGASSGGGLDGGFAYLNTQGVDPLQLSQDWSSSQVRNLLYTANITAVPEPETYAMLLAGLGLVGAIARRKRAAT